MKIAYFGYDFFFSCLEILIQRGHTIQKVFSFPCDNTYNFNTKLKKLSKDITAPFTLEKVTKKDVDDLIQSGCELIVIAGYQYKIPVKNISLPVINIHPTLLPMGRGQWPLPWVILKNLKKSGVTIHKVTEDLDAGDILLQKSFRVDEFETLETLSAKSQILAQKLISQVLSKFDFYFKNAKPQRRGASVWSMPTVEERTLNWNKTGKEIMKVVRAFGKFDSFAIFDKKEWIIQDARVWKEKHSYQSGTVVHPMNKEVVIAIKDGFICLTSYQVDPDFKE